MMNGSGYVFLRRDGAPLPPGCAGHVGWGFQLDPVGNCYFGATENLSGGPIVQPGRDNGWWASQGDRTAMLAAMSKRHYDGYKVAVVRDAHPDLARAAADATGRSGYRFIRNNCLDHVWGVLNAFGMAGLPWRETHPSPNDWFAVFNGEYHNL